MKILAKELKKPLLNRDYAAVYERVLEGLNLLNGLDKVHLFKNKNRSAGLLLNGC